MHTLHRESFKVVFFAIAMLLASAFDGSAASYRSRKKVAEELFKSPPQIEIRIDPANMQILRAYNQVWRQTRPERIDARATVLEGGKTYTNVAVHLKGSYSFQPVDEKPSLTLNFSKFAPGQTFNGLTKIHLNNSVQDDSYLCEQLARQLFTEGGVPAPRAVPARVKLNGRDLGLSVLIEGANKGWVKRHFASADGNLYDGGSGGEITRALEADSGKYPENRTDLTNLVKAAREPNIQKRYQRLSELLDVEQFITFAATEAFLVHWDGYAIGGNNYRLFHDVSRGKMVFIPSGMDQLFGTSSSPNLNVTPVFKGLVAKSLLAIPEARERYLTKLKELSINRFTLENLHARVDALAEPVRIALKGNRRELQDFEIAVQSLKARMAARCRSVAQQLQTPTQPVAVPTGEGMRIAPWSPKAGATVSGGFSRSINNGTELLTVTGRGEGSSGAWRSTLLLGPGRYELSGLARTEGISARPGETNGVILRISGERSVEGITVNEHWTRLRYEFDVQGIENVELVCEFRGATGSGTFNAASIRLARKEP